MRIFREHCCQRKRSAFGEWAYEAPRSKMKKAGTEEYEVENLSESGKRQLVALKFASARIDELTKMHALLQRAKNSYVASLKKEIVSSKAGFVFGED